MGVVGRIGGTIGPGAALGTSVDRLDLPFGVSVFGASFG